MQLTELNSNENDRDISATIGYSESQDNCKSKNDLDNVPNSLKTPKLQSAMEATSEILEALKRATVINAMIPNGYPSINEVYPGLFIGNQYAAFDKALLKDSGITHVLNVAQGKNPDCVDSNELYYEDVDIIFLGIRLMDSPRVRIYQFFRPAVAFIHQALAGGGKVLVHSKRGVSRAPTLACSYLIIKKQLAVKESLLHINKFRTVTPNRGFVGQLLELEWRRSSFLKGNCQTAGIDESRGDPECENNEGKSSQDVQPYEKGELNKLKEVGKNDIYRKMCSEGQIINGTNEFIENGYNTIEGSTVSTFYRTKEKNSDMPENGSYCEKDSENDKNTTNSKKCHAFHSTTKDVLAAIREMPVSQKMLDRVTSIEPTIDEVYPGLYISNQHAALNKAFLKEVGITHILNVAHGEGINFIETNEDFYKDLDISFLGIRIPDSPYVRIAHVFPNAYSFIEECLRSGGKILIHSVQGTSRATTIACSYIMVKENRPVRDSLMSIGQVRVVMPNRGFISQLCELQWRRCCELDHKKSPNSLKNGIIATNDHTILETASNIKKESAEVVEKEIKDPVHSGEPRESGANSPNDSRRKNHETNTKFPTDHRSPTKKVTEILGTLQAKAIESNIKRSVASTTPDMEEVYPGLYIGNQHAALDKSFLKHSGITHILNAASGKESDFVNTSNKYYQDIDIKFLGLKVSDSPKVRIFQFFKPTFHFIKNALADGKKVLVHSKRGISRAPTLACCYIMLSEHKSCLDSLVSMCQFKAVLPNRGFISQLIELEWRRGSILNDSVNSNLRETKITLADISQSNRPISEEYKEGNGFKTNPQEEQESVTYKTENLNKKYENQINGINNLKDLHISDMDKTELSQESMTVELKTSNNLVTLDPISSIIKTTEVMCAMKDITATENKCAQTCMWEINMLV
ncbi:uncharacterized protein [Macrobrachium rosenbergii]|uniref:uncharacterized protein n=1 Tax=Macrobrachium rosenbergii TaxID=79674 RepID=UPI0034D69C45